VVHFVDRPRSRSTSSTVSSAIRRHVVNFPPATVTRPLADRVTRWREDVELLAGQLPQRLVPVEAMTT